jgi:hypothetical protein
VIIQDAKPPKNRCAYNLKSKSSAGGESFDDRNILTTDIGRRITELKPDIDIPDFENILRDVIETLDAQQRKVKDSEGREYSLRVRPYRTTDNKIDGAVITPVELEGRRESYAGKTSKRAKQGSPRK